MRLPLFTAYPDGSITGKPSNTPVNNKVLWDNKTIRAIRKKDGTIKIRFKR